MFTFIPYIFVYPVRGSHFISIGRMNGTHEGIYTVGLGACLNVDRY
jgi:hypothetical protein